MIRKFFSVREWISENQSLDLVTQWNLLTQELENVEEVISLL